MRYLTETGAIQAANTRGNDNLRYRFAGCPLENFGGKLFYC